MAVFSSVNKHLDCNQHGWLNHGLLLSCLCFLLCCELSCGEVQLVGYRPQGLSTEVSLHKDGVYRLIVKPGAAQPTPFLIFAFNLTNTSIVKFTTSNSTCDSQDHLLGSSSIALLEGDGGGDVVSTYQLNISFISPVQSSRHLYFCIKNRGFGYRHQGVQNWVRLTLEPQPFSLPLWFEIVGALVMLCFSGMFSGLNLGLMALDPVTLKIVMKSGTDRQKWAARTIYRVRKYGNYLLCTLLLGNVLVNSVFTILLGSVLTGPIAIAGSTLAIVIFGEIVPQAICSRFGLYVGAYTIPLTYIFMVVTFPLSLPISLILHLILGKEIGSVYKREQILELLHVTQKDAQIDDNELNIISGALRFKNKQVKDVMTKMENVFCIDITSVLDFKTIKQIYDSGFSRIPIFEEEKTNIVGVLYLRDLTFIDPEDCTPVKQVKEYYDRDVWFVFDDFGLDQVLLDFVEGTHHLAVVRTIVEQEGGDNYYKVIGVITLEDIIEEILGREIVDEYDQYRDNVTMKPLKRKHADVDIAEDMYTTPLITLTAPQTLAVEQFLSGTKAFCHERITTTVLRRLLQQDVVFKLSVDECREREFALYKEGTPANYFTLVLEGRLNVSIGNENMVFEASAFYHFGEKCLLDSVDCDTILTEVSPYIPDFTVRPIADSLVLIVTRSCYLAAYRTSQLEMKQSDPVQLQTSLSDADTKLSLSLQANRDVFSQEWHAAKDTDLQTSMVGGGGGGLGSITRLLQTKPLQRIKVRKKQATSTTGEEQDKVPLCQQDSTSSDSHVFSEECAAKDTDLQTSMVGGRGGGLGSTQRLLTKPLQQIKIHKKSTTGEEEEKVPLCQWDSTSSDSHVFSEELQAAKDTDLQTSMVGGRGGGLGSIQRLLTKPLQQIKIHKKSTTGEEEDKVPLCQQDSTSSDSLSNTTETSILSISCHHKSSV